MPTVLTGVGLDTTACTSPPGFTIAFSGVTSDAPPATISGTRPGLPAICKHGEIQFSNRLNVAVDTGDISITKPD